MLYTSVPIEQVMANNAQTDMPAKELHALYLGEEVLVLQGASGEYTINRLLSHNPQSYLKPTLSPGAVADSRLIELISP